MSLIPFSSVKAYLGIPIGVTDKDEILQIFQDSVETSVIAYCETDFGKTVISGLPGEILDGTDSDTVVPVNYPIVSIEGVWFGVEADGSGGTKLDPLQDYYVTPSAVVLMRGRHTPNARGAVRLAYTYGYNQVPSDVKLAILQSVRAEYSRWINKQEGLSSRSKEGESESFGASAWDSTTGLPKTVMSKLQHYRKMEIPPVSNMAQRNR